ncbi:MAG: hypothetical protein ABI777_00120 [Betaproteobacteria bacterium]
MNKVETTLRRWAFWLLPFVLLGLLIAWQTDWGRAWSRVPPAAASVVPPPVTIAVLPAYVTDATAETSRDTIDRTLFNPTRRPAPVAVVEAAKPRMQRGQFALTGTLLTDGKSTAFLRDINGGKSRRVMQGETVNGMLVAEVKANGVRLTLGDETEELGLKLAVGPRTTIQPVAIRPTPEAAMAAAGLSPADAARIAPQVRDVADVLAERRRMARDAEAAAAGRAPGTPLVAPTAAGATPSPAAPAATGAAANDPAWASVYQRYQQPRR